MYLTPEAPPPPPPPPPKNFFSTIKSQIRRKAKRAKSVPENIHHGANNQKSMCSTIYVESIRSTWYLAQDIGVSRSVNFTVQDL